MRRSLSYPIDASLAGMRIGDFLRQMGYSRHVLMLLKQTEGGILLNGSPAFTNRIMEDGDVLQILICEDVGSEQLKPVKMDLDIVYEDEDLMVINKPADIPIHPSINNHENTLANGIAAYFAAQNIPYTYRCINRLDRDTSGLLILAKHMLSGTLLSAMSMRREIHREYFALVEGFLPEEGTIDAPIARAKDSAIRRCVDEETGEQAITHFRRVGYEDGISAVRIHLETGRTHQIRVHMSHTGHPLLGDFLYNPDYLQRPDCKIKRQALHSCRLELEHPITHQKLHFYTKPPKDILDCIPIISNQLFKADE